MERAAHAVLDAAYDRRRAPLRRRPLLRARGGVPRRPGCARAGCAATTSWSARSGATSTPPAGGSTPSTHEVKELSAEQLRTPVGARSQALLGEWLRALPDPLRDARQRRARRPGRARASSTRSARAASGSGSRSPGPTRRRRSTARSRSAASTRSRRRGTCTSAARAPRSPAPTTPGCEVYVKEALANGRLTDRGAAPALVAAARRARGRRADALALAAVLAQPWADVVLSGAATVAQLESNLAAARRGVGRRRSRRALAGLAEEPGRTGSAGPRSRGTDAGCAGTNCGH